MTFNNDAIESINQDQNLIYHTAKSIANINTSLSRISYNSLIVFLFEFARHISSITTRINIYLFLSVRQSSSTIVRAFFITTRKTVWNTHVYISNWRVVFARVIYSLNFYLIYLLDNFLRNLHEHLHHNLRHLTKTYAFARQIDAFSFSSFRRVWISIRLSWNLLFFRSLLVNISIVTLLSTVHILLRFRFLLRWSRYSHTKNE